MRVLLALCSCLAVASAGIIAYPFGYDTGYIGHPVTTLISRPYVPAYPGSYSYQFVIGPSFSHGLYPGSVVLTPFPEFLPFPPPTLDDKKGKGGKKDKKNKKGEKDGDADKKDDKDDTTEMPDKEKGDDEDDKKSEVEDLRE